MTKKIIQDEQIFYEKPIIKWIGGKTQIIDTVIENFPNEINNYHELFLGGGSVLIAVLQNVQKNKIKINGTINAYDINETLINMYKNILQVTNYNDVDKFFTDKNITLDEIFINITTIYTPEIYNIYYNVLLLLSNEDDVLIINNIITGLNLIMYKNNKLIQNWIKTNSIIAIK